MRIWQTQPKMAPKAVPIIRVEDWCELPETPLVTLYVCGDNELVLDDIFLKIKNLSDNLDRGHYTVVKHQSTGEPDEFSMTECKPDFLKILWECFAHIVDYFADFAVFDKPDMLTIWFDLVDELQQVVRRLPHQHWVEGLPCCGHAEDFTYEYEGVIKLLNNLITPVCPEDQNPLVRANKDITGPSKVDLRGFKAGLKPWEQYLSHGGPGFDVPYDKQIFDKDARMGIAVGEELPEQYIPMGGLAIIARHTKRLRRLAIKIHEQIPDGQKTRTEEKMLEEFDSHAVDLTQPFSTYTSLDGRHKSAEKTQPAPDAPSIPRKYQGLGDPAFIVEHPDLNLIDEAVGCQRGLEEFAHPDGGNNQDFKMLAIRAMPATAAPPDPIIDESEYTDLCDHWPDMKKHFD
ncbi:hypothetical protein DM02DRAFT_425776 [Periconia macrospinosa]|uniref:Uncharacterized protein n=1 Tax=Periconia macrospinosa TaxID=97972 RepID=A0A2V1E8R3_9PLEO|nr:hypothetical protein DM02DRAFT_425776 [Periconia macrospinosa]